MMVCTCSVGRVPLLFDKFGSKVVAKAEPMFVRTPANNVVFVSMKLYGSLVGNDIRLVEPATEGATFTVKLVACPLASDGRTGQVTTPFERMPPPEALVNKRFVGRRSCVRVFAADDGPALVTRMV